MNWVAVGRYILARTSEPSIVHRGFAAVTGCIAALSLSGPSKWVAIIVSASSLIGILMPDAVHSGYNDASQNVGETAKPKYEQTTADVVTQTTTVHQSGPAHECVHPTPDFVRQPVPAEHRIEENPYPDKFESSGGWGDK